MHHRALLTTALSLLATGTLLAQEAPRPRLADDTTLATTGTTAPIPVVTATLATTTTSGTVPTGEEVVEMSVFNVNADKDEGYQSLSTASGSRINTALKDTPAAISVFSKEFLDDVGANTIEDMLAYAGNVEADAGDSGDTSGDDDASRNAGSQDNRFRIRGMSMDISLDNVQTGNPIDTYNIDRAEISSGPNSILYGMGSAGGVVTLASKRANPQRNTTRIQTAVGTWSNLSQPWNYFRATLDYNVVLMPRKMALRINSIYQEGGNASWRKWMGLHDRRINPVLTIRPFKNTTININYETGRRREGITSAWNLSDGLTAWLAAGNPVLDSFNPPATDRPQSLEVQYGDLYWTVNPIVQQNSNGASPRFTLFDNNNTLYDMRQSYYSNNIFPGNGTNYRLPASMSPYNYSTMGPGGMRDQRFSRYQLVIEQRLGNFNFQLAYDYNKNNSYAYSPQGQDSQLLGDPNSWISTYNWTGPGGVVADPYAGQLYVEDRWIKRVLDTKNEVFRLSSEYSINLKRYGRHRFVLNLERAESDRYNNGLNQTLVDQNQIAISAPNTPANAQNYIFRRQYVDEGDFSTYYPGNPTAPLPEIYMNGKVYHDTWVGSRTSISHIRRFTNTAGITYQGYMFHDSLVATIGGRFDDITFKRATRSQINDPFDPRITSGSKVWREFDFNGGWETPKRYQPYTISAGGVWHAVNRLSPFINYSTNRGAPYLDGRTVLPDGLDPQPSQGRTLDYGVMFDALGNGKLFIRLTKFDTKVFYDASNGGGDQAYNAALGATNLFNIYDALYFLNVTNQTGIPDTTPFATPTGGTIHPGPGAGPGGPDNTWGWQYAVVPPSTVADPNDTSLPYGAPPAYNAATFNTHSSGYEAELTANITKNFTMRVTFSWTQQERLNLFDEIFDFYNKNIPVWMAMSQQTNPDPTSDGQYWVSVGGYRYTLYDYLYQQLYALGSGVAIGGGNDGANGTSVRQGLATRLLNVSGAMGARPIKFNIMGRYSFRNGWLKGFQVGGGVRYQSRNRIPDPNRLINALAYLPPADGSEGLALDRDIFTNTAGMKLGNSLTFWNAFLTYKCKFFGGRTNATFQLNINNIFNQSLVTVSRVSQYNAITRVIVNPPRQIRFSATFNF